MRESEGASEGGVRGGRGLSRDELGVVVGQQAELLAPPGQEGSQGAVGVVRHGGLVPVRPHLQTDQSHTDAQGPVVLRGVRERSALSTLGPDDI